MAEDRNFKELIDFSNTILEVLFCRYLFYPVQSYDTIFLKSIFKIKLAKCYQKLGMYQQSIEYYNELQIMTQNDYKVLYSKAKSCIKVQDISQAQKLFEDLIKIDYQCYKAYQQLGLINFQHQEYIKAIQFFDKSILYKKQNLKSYFYKGIALQYLGQFDEAIKMYNHALQIKPNDANIYMNIGVSLFHLGQFNEAIKMYNLSLQINPNNAKTFVNKGGDITFKFQEKRQTNQLNLMMQSRCMIVLFNLIQMMLKLMLIQKYFTLLKRKYPDLDEKV